MDNASTHMNSKVATLILRATGAYLVYTAPYSPDLNPIELAFSIYKSYLKQNFSAFEIDWYSTHLDALDQISSDTCIAEFRRCGVPMSYEVLTTNELEEVVAVALISNLL